MFISKKIVYIEVPKTASSHIRKTLNEVIGGKIVDNHNQITNDLSKDRVVIGSIRSPLDWWVSMFAYGCAGKGSVYKNLVKPKRIHFKSMVKNKQLIEFQNITKKISKNSKKLIKRLYLDSKDKGAFNEWMYFMQDPENASLYNTEYHESGLSEIYSLYTFWVQKLLCSTKDNNLKLSSFSADYIRKNIIVDEIIRVESLEDDLREILIKHGVQYNKTKENKRTNTSLRLDYKHYYNHELEKLVYRKDSPIINYFG